MGIFEDLLKAIGGNDVDEACRLVAKLISKPDQRALNHRDGKNRTVLICAAQAKQPEVCLAILSSPKFTEVNAKDERLRTALHWAAITGLPAVCAEPLEHDRFTE